MFARLCVLILIACGSILSGCATKQTAQADPNSIIREPESNHEIHGEVGMMYGGSAR
jgi:hypothetical protein